MCRDPVYFDRYAFCFESFELADFFFFFFFLNPTRFNWPKAIIVETSNLQFTP